MDRGAGAEDKDSGAGRTHRIVVAVALAPNLPQHCLGETLAQSLRDETGETVLLVKLASVSGSEALSFESILGAGAGARVSLPQNNGSISQITLQVRDSADAVTPLLHYLGSQFDCVIVQGDFLETPRRELLEFAALADSVYLFLPAGADEFRRFEFFASVLRSRLPGDALDLHAVICLSRAERAEVPLAFSANRSTLSSTIVRQPILSAPTERSRPLDSGRMSGGSPVKSDAVVWAWCSLPAAQKAWPTSA